MIDSADLHTETFTNRQGWTVVRVTHLPTGDVAERERSRELASSVQAQSECIEELRRRVATPSAVPLRSVPSGDRGPVSRADFDALVARVEALERAAARSRTT